MNRAKALRKERRREGARMVPWSRVDGREGRLGSEEAAKEEESWKRVAGDQ